MKPVMERSGSAMRQAAIRRAGAAGIALAACLAVWPQAPATQPPPSQAPSSPAVPTASSSPDSVTGGTLHGVVKSGTIPLPGVSVTAQNTLTGKRYSTTSDITGAWQMKIPLNGRYVIRTHLAAFAGGSQEAVLNATSHDPTVNFELILASRQATLDQQQASQQSNVAAAVGQLVGNSPENLTLLNTLAADTDTGAGTAGVSGAALPSIAGNSDFSDESVAITGQAGQVSALAGIDVDRVRDAIQSIQVQGGLNGQSGDGGHGGLFGGYGGGGGFGGGGGGFGGGGGGFGGRGGGGGGGVGNLRNFKDRKRGVE